MSSTCFYIHPQNPQPRLIKQVVDILRAGGVIVYPTDSCYALGCQMGNKAAMERIARIRQTDRHHHFTLVCSHLSEVAHYARVNDRQYRLLRACTPGPYTFLLEATRQTPKRLQNPKRHTIGIRIPDHPVSQMLLSVLSEPLMSSTLHLPGDEWPMTEGVEIQARLELLVDAVIDGGHCGLEPTTVVDLVADVAVIVRPGKGSLRPFGLD